MKTYLGSALSAALLLAMPSVVSAGELKLTLNNGRATVIATNVPLNQILAEWARVGKTTIVNADKLTGPPVTLVLEDVPEREALEVILRSASGYIVAARQDVMADASSFDRILIMPASRPPAVSAATSTNTPGRFPNRPPTPQPMVMEPDSDDDVDPPVGPVMGPQGNVNGNIPHPNDPTGRDPNGVREPTRDVSMPEAAPGAAPGTAPRPGMPTALPPGQQNPYPPTLPSGVRPPVRPGGGGGGDDR